MWRYQKPGFEALLLAELQRQQQCSQFCDTMLKAEGVSVPAHSCVVSAISPHVSSALSSTPAPPAGQSRLLEFQAIGACTLLHMVSLLYSGEMAGEGEKERQEAISAAAKLGIDGLVEVTRRDPVSFETTDMAALQGVGQTNSHYAPPQIPYIPITLVYPPENHTNPPSSAPATFMQDSAAAGLTSVAVVAPSYNSVPPSLQPVSTVCAADLKSCLIGFQGATRDAIEGEEWPEEQFQHFQGNIPGFISYFLNPDKEEGSCRGRAGRRRGARVARARRAGTGERRARRPRATTGGRGRGGMMQTVDGQEVWVGKQQKLFLQRCGGRSSRTGQGGGAAGRKLYLNSRDVLKSAEKCRSRRRRGKVWEFSPSGELLPLIDRGRGGGGGGGGGRMITRQQMTQLYNIHTLSNLSLQPSPSSVLQSPAAAYMLPAASLLHTTSLPPPALPPHEEQPEQIDRLLEEVMMGLDILPNNNNNSAPSSQPPISTRSSNCEVPVLQQHGEGGLNVMLDHFLQSFEQHIAGCGAREEEELDGESSTELHTVPDRRKKTKTRPITSNSPRPQNTHSTNPVVHSQTTELQRSDEAITPASASSPVTLKHAEETSGKVGPPRKRTYKRRRKRDYVFSLERVRVKVRKPVTTSDTKTKIIIDQGDKLLRQVAVVKLERRGLMPGRVTGQEHRCRGLEVKSPEKRKTSSSEKCPDDSSVKNPPELWNTKTYPIRSRLREAFVTDSLSFLQEPLLDKQQHYASSRKSRQKKNGQLLSSPSDGSSTPQVQLQPLEPCATNEQLEKNQERLLAEFPVLPEEEAEGPSGRGKKRRAESGGDTSDDATVAKRVCFEQMTEPTSETCTRSSEAADFVSEKATTRAEEVIDVESLMDEEAKSSSDEIIDVDGDTDGGTDLEDQTVNYHCRTVPTTSHSVRSPGSWEDEDVDVIGVPSPFHEPLIISWTEASDGDEEDGDEDEDEDIDVVGEKTDCAPSVVFASVNKGGLVN
ncbi:putative BTB/POZ domain-containing protein 18 [Scophthalmus maximus]|uniref:Putative BTB/POZ domain-containing protein 18 n=1 Tax=Scophthalmus maximus TaxID=52904 RepID=A0A2U9CAU8_SCOMX|nr:putative BTB/POZ domain-containing protein 18 [Scophthalmus maximus]